MDNIKKISELGRASPTFTSRLSAEDYKVGEVTFQLRALPGSVDTYIHANMVRGGNVGEAVILYCRLGITGIRGLCSDDGYKISPAFTTLTIMGRDFKALSWEILDGLRDADGSGASGLLTELMSRIISLTRMGEEEKLKQDFTSASSLVSSDAEEEQNAPAEGGG